MILMYNEIGHEDKYFFIYGGYDMKKLISLFLAVVMLVLLVSCGPTGVPGESEDEKKPSVELSRGKIEGDVYESEYMNLKFTKPASWVYSTDDEIAAALNLGVEFMGDKFKEAVETNPTVYDMMVIDSLTRSNINVGYENLSKTFSSNITIEQYIEAFKQQLSSVSGMTVTFPDSVDSVKLGDCEYSRLVCDVSVAGVSMTQVYYLRKVEGYMCFVIVTIVSGYTVAQIEAMFN